MARHVCYFCIEIWLHGGIGDSEEAYMEEGSWVMEGYIDGRSLACELSVPLVTK